MADGSIATDPAITRRGARPSAIARPGPLDRNQQNEHMNDRNDNSQTPESLEEQIERLEIRKLRAEPQLIEAGMRRDRHRLVLDIAKWSIIGGAVVLAYIGANHVGVI